LKVRSVAALSVCQNFKQRKESVHNILQGHSQMHADLISFKTAFLQRHETLLVCQLQITMALKLENGSFLRRF